MKTRLKVADRVSKPRFRHRAVDHMFGRFTKVCHSLVEQAEDVLVNFLRGFFFWIVEPIGDIFLFFLRIFARWFKVWWFTFGLVFMLIGVAGLLYLLGWPLLIRIHAGVSDLTLEPGSEGASRVATQAAAVIGGAVGFIFLFWRTWLIQRQTHIANETLYTQLLTKAVEQLGATREEKETRDINYKDQNPKCETVVRTVPNIEVRIGAIYALEKIS